MLEKKIAMIKEKIEQIKTRLYQEKIPEASEDLNALINELLALLDYIGEQTERKEKNAGAVQELKRILGEILNSMEEKDWVLMADLLYYELTEALDAIEE